MILQTEHYGSTEQAYATCIPPYNDEKKQYVYSNYPKLVSKKLFLNIFKTTFAGVLRCPVSAVDAMTSAHRETEGRTDTTTNQLCPRVNRVKNHLLKIGVVICIILYGQSKSKFGYSQFGFDPEIQLDQKRNYLPIV